VLAIYSTFLQRGYDQLIHDVAIQNLPVVFALDRAGIVGGDGATHNGVFDLAYLRCVPNMVVMTPSDENECRQMLYTACQLDSPSAVRYPRGTGPGTPVSKAMSVLPIGQSELRRTGKRVALLAFGSLVPPALQAAEELDATVVNMRFVKPIDTARILEMARTHELLVTLEEHQVMGGAGSAVAEVLSQAGVATQLLHLGLPDRFIDHGDPALLLASVGLDKAGIVSAVRNRLGG
jgi:1-deoxy-D-xylulose-5-phosphate synthase